MKKYLVIGNPIDHSLSPKLHNYWMKKYRLIDSVYEKKKVEKKDLKNIVEQVRNGQIKGVNITVPFKKEIIDLLDCVQGDALLTQSVNTLCKVDKEVHGYNTDTQGFKESLQGELIDYKNKNIFILGAGGVTPSILEAFVNTAKKIYITNRTKEKAEELKTDEPTLSYVLHKYFYLDADIDWGKKLKPCDVVINTTSVGLTKDENLDLDFEDYENNKNVLFYDLIYNPKETNFLKDAKLRGNKVMNGKMMFLNQAKYAFKIWTGISPEIDDEVIRLLD